MTTYDDLSEYRYYGSEPGTKNVGWLGSGLEFEQAEQTPDILDRVWEFCKMPVVQTRGFHWCEFCGHAVRDAERNGEKIFMGSAEIRVFSRGGAVYAAPTLIYHYMKCHDYRPPDEFIRALEEGPAPSTQEYRDRLGELGLP